MLLTESFMIQLIIIIVSVILSYLLYKYLNNDLINIYKLIENDIEKFTISQDMFDDETIYPILENTISQDMFDDETIYPILENNTNIIKNIKEKILITKENRDEINRLERYIRK